ncbi:MAG: CoA transferase [Candidatus Eisenbacteria bacterium]|nr:CoA transferase [Candidatus Eisenbacteria bacterium]
MVLDLSRVLAGPYATQMLGDLGAEVWKIERPGVGDETRAWGPPFVGGESAYFLSVNRSKRSVVLDFRDARDRDALLRAAREADVVVENFLPGDLERFALDARSLRAAHPDLVTCSITGFGQDGPYASLPGYDAVLQGFTGLMSVTGEPDGAPLKVGVALIDVLTGAHAAAAILAALVGRLRGCGGVALDIALFEVGVASLVNVAQAALATGAPARRHGNAHPHIVPYQTFEARDGALVIAVGNDEQWRRLCEALDLEDLGRDGALASNPGRLERRAEVTGAIARRLAGRPRDEWLARLRAARVPAGPVRDIAEVMRDPALAARDMVRSATLPGSGSPVEVLSLPWRSDGVRPALHLPPPRLGAHGTEFRARFG